MDEDDYSSWWLDISIGQRFMDADEDEYLTHFSARIVRESEIEPKEQIAGSIEAILVDFGRAAELDGLSLHDVLDYDLIAYQYADLVGEDLNLRADLEDKFGIIDRILILDRIAILPEFRGHALSHWATCALVNLLAPANVLTVIIPHPLQFSPGDDREEWQPYHLESLPQDKAAAFRKVREHWRRLGFEKIGGSGDTELWALDPVNALHCRQRISGTAAQLP